jgi:GTP cyclohydrolase I
MNANRPIPPVTKRPTRKDAEAAYRTLLLWIGEDPAREGLRETPARAARALAEWTSGNEQDPVAILSKKFGEVEDYDEMIMVGPIRFESMCEHHLAQFTGTAWVGYIPKRRKHRGKEQVVVVGLSKVARAIDALARRLQVQERLTVQIADAMERALEPLAVGVVLVAEHSCMCTRGVRKPGAKMKTSRMRGAFRKDPAARAEFFAMLSATSE